MWDGRTRERLWTRYDRYDDSSNHEDRTATVSIRMSRLSDGECRRQNKDDDHHHHRGAMLDAAPGGGGGGGEQGTEG